MTRTIEVQSVLESAQGKAARQYAGLSLGCDATNAGAVHPGRSAVYLARRNRRSSPDQVARIFGFGRTASHIRMALEESIETWWTSGCRPRLGRSLPSVGSLTVELRRFGRYTNQGQTRDLQSR
jgi:hypothetical protein